MLKEYHVLLSESMDVKAFVATLNHGVAIKRPRCNAMDTAIQILTVFVRLWALNDCAQCCY